MPTHKEAMPLLLLGVAGSTNVEVDSRMKEPSDTGPVLNAGPMAALTEAMPTAASEEMIWLEDGIVAIDCDELGDSDCHTEDRTTPVFLCFKTNSRVSQEASSSP